MTREPDRQEAEKETDFMNKTWPLTAEAAGGLKPWPRLLGYVTSALQGWGAGLLPDLIMNGGSRRITF
jgi:hypothetical protein